MKDLSGTFQASSRRRWVPISSLTRRHRQRMIAHLLALSPHDRYLRFGYKASDAQIERYVLDINFARDEVFGIFNRRLELIALAHLAYASPQPLGGHAAMAEFGVSVRPSSRGRGYGSRLFDHAVMHARNRGTDKLFIQALSENTAMLEIARRAGATVERDGAESQAWLQLPPDTVTSQVEQMVETQAAEFDYQLKRQAMRWEKLLETAADVRAQFVQSARSALE